VRFVAALAGLLFAALHGAGSRAVLNDERVPPPAAMGWVAAAAAAAIGALLLLATASAVAVVLQCGGVVATVGLAMANGRWMHGRVTVSHHVVRAAFALLVIVPAVLAL